MFLNISETVDCGLLKIIGVPPSVADITSIDIGILPSKGTPSRSLSSAPPPYLNKLIGKEKFPSSSVVTS